MNLHHGAFSALGSGGIVVFGPGDMRTAHSSSECVPLAELEQAVDCLTALMKAG